MEGIIQFQDGVDGGIFKKNNYFQLEYHDGKKTLWRIEKPWGKYAMWGPPTEKRLILTGKKGYNKVLGCANGLVQEEFGYPEVFSWVRACGGWKTYLVNSLGGLKRAENVLREKYCKDFDDGEIAMSYCLSVRFAMIDSDHAIFGVFIVNSGNVGASILHDSIGYMGNGNYAVRPEAVINPYCYVQMDGRDGSKEKPYILLSSATSDKR